MNVRDRLVRMCSDLSQAYSNLLCLPPTTENKAQRLALFNRFDTLLDWFDKDLNASALKLTSPKKTTWKQVFSKLEQFKNSAHAHAKATPRPYDKLAHLGAEKEFDMIAETISEELYELS